MAALWTPTFGDAQDIGFGSNTYTTPTENFGTGYAIVWFWNDNGSHSIATVLICGQPAAQLLQGSVLSVRMEMWAAPVFAATGTVQAVISGGSAFGTIASNGGLLTGANTTPTSLVTNSAAGNPDPQSISINIPTNGVAVVGIGAEAGTAEFPAVWTPSGVREAIREAGVNTGNQACVAGGSYAVPGLQTITAAGSTGNGFGFSNNNMLAAAFGPAASPSVPLVGPLGFTAAEWHHREFSGWRRPLFDPRRRVLRPRRRTLVLPARFSRAA